MPGVRRTSAVLGGLAAGALLASVSVPDAARDFSELKASATSRWEGGSPSTLTELLPNAKHAGDPVWAWSDRVVVGTVVSVVPEAGHIEFQRPESPEGVVVTGAHTTRFDDPKADWRTLTVRLDVEETLAGPPSPVLELSWGLFRNGNRRDDAEAIGRALKALGRIVVFTRADRSPDPDDLAPRRVVAHPQLGIVQVGPEGSLRPPFASGAFPGGSCCPFDPVSFLSGIDTLDELRVEAAQPDRLLPPPP